MRSIKAIRMLFHYRSHLLIHLSVGCVILAALLFACPTAAPGQSALDEKLQVADELQPLDGLLREQLAKFFAKRDAAAFLYGRDSEQWFQADDQNNPIAVHGARILQYARQHPGTPESLICLSYIVDWGEGDPKPLYESACTELVAQQKDNPAVSWLCSRCTNELSLKSMEGFLGKLLETSPNSTIQAAAAYNLARLYDNALEARQNLATVRKRFQEVGMIKARPYLEDALVFLKDQSPAKLAARRDELLGLVLAKYADEKPWSADRTFGRLNYKFRTDPRQPTFGELAGGLKYELENLRVGSVAPDFKATDIDGRSFRLAENRGKFILLMFSFKGCAACEATYPAIREIRERFSPDNLSVLGVMADESVDTVRGTVAADDITWQCMWEGPSGPIAKIYKVHGYPTLILIDSDGRIASTSLNRGDLVATVEGIVERKSAK